jgi:hypothetical protein
LYGDQPLSGKFFHKPVEGIQGVRELFGLKDYVTKETKYDLSCSYKLGEHL